MKKYIFILLVLLIPAFSLMLRPGIFTMHDFHPFRQYEFSQCVAAKTFPCRWAPDAGMGYGEPVFNFYGQFPYWVGQIFHSLGLQIIDSVKANFILTIIVSAVGMYLLGKKYWGNLGGMIAALFYIYAPYRAVDVWVRGSLNEAYALALFPFIFLSLDNFLDDHQPRHLWWLVFFASALLITHNLSALMIAPFLAIWVFKKFPVPFSRLIAAAAAVFLLSAFYLLPVIFESRLVTLNLTTSSYYNYQLHWTTLKQLFISRFWGYGGSTWGPNDTMSFSVGYLQWLVPLFLLLRKKSLAFIAFGFFAVFLTHGKSEFIWKLFPPLAYIQFPWRFLAVSTFFLSLSSGAISQVFSKKILSLLIILVILINFSFFRPDIWRSIGDKEQFSGALWDEQRSSALQDFWPKTAKQLPTGFAPRLPQVLLTTDTYQKIQYPIVYFPGWKSQVELFPSGPLGLITARVPLGTQINLKFTNTPIRTIGNITSLVALLCLILSGYYLLPRRV
ncbi:MAG: hypothetical protein UX99_C0005G0020 [Candidatus Amesbacteria bacterium GW2011_GWB1_47_26]|uniref:Membrane protein 6-pyruvoyl-tetrahydropterin synthase-related domain-containing protein n=1 Tax=Candidatus Amesbacteria bacterium GW2011_GWC2_45_19 TaxID=1618366 RepID=A0A0G1Q490_9BACT|nr:MAG: hypothetical protein UX05_C0001G0119 [Candidatus Amesbacteria bacterium GW2011_GWC2_45_19]KKU38284.1 MAG: hypothetical protein UX52_C0008G0025 [Candidatus Amesbacteria bacterium GW2011_GWA1_46_35]KKU69527.1 MAG: hypothetical protein UX93_C0001G0112 [Microgenomates group bacterium GW2011_GWC1_47_20]KKU74860.1 MAG: hypothetical protein UX99_C0005G0020 [Candidatus Amesbacteria bacterium GW2011_GWB1_47_26]